MLAVRESWSLSVTPRISAVWVWTTTDLSVVIVMSWVGEPWKEKQLGLVKVEFQVVCGHPMKEFSQTGRDTFCYLCFRLGETEN